MKLFFFSLFSLALCAVAASARADDQVRAAQSRLQDGGFYFGEVNGVYGSETAAAVSRYQIRNGLKITGQLDDETAKSLGVSAAPAGAASSQPEAETWRRLRKSDEQFLSRLNAGEIPPPATPAAITPPADAGPRTLVLSRERLRDYIAAFVLAGLDRQVGAELEFFGEKVDYFNDGFVQREKIRRDLDKYNRRWPERSFRLAGEVEVQPQPGSRLRVSFPLRYELRNGAKHAAGKVRKTLVLEVVGADLEIVGVDERKN